MEDLHREIERVAYELWEKEGRIPGRDVEHWRAAQTIVAARLEEGSELVREGLGECEEPSPGRKATHNKEGKTMSEQQSSKPQEGAEQITAALNGLVKTLGSVSGVLESVLSAITNNPQLLEGLLRPIGQAVAEIGKTVGKTVPEAGKALGSTVGGAVSDVGKTAGQAVGSVSEIGKPVGEVVGNLGESLGGGAGQQLTGEAKKKQEMVQSLMSQLNDKQLMNKSVEELEAISKAIGERKTA